MKSIGFIISEKENEWRRALVPSDLRDIKQVSWLYFETGYGDVLGYRDQDYRKMGFFQRVINLLLWKYP